MLQRCCLLHMPAKLTVALGIQTAAASIRYLVVQLEITVNRTMRQWLYARETTSSLHKKLIERERKDVAGKKQKRSHRQLIA